MNRRTLLLDGDVFAYVAAAAVEKPINWGGEGFDAEQWTLHSDAGEACRAADDAIERIVEFLGGSHVIIALSHRENWRKLVLPTYKANRANVRKPLVLSRVRQYIRQTYTVVERPGLEGDDVLGILMTGQYPPLGERICITVDKDLKTIPGLHFNNRKRGDGIFEVTEREADRYHLYQTLMGDQTDGYTGCPGVGPTVADQFLDEPYKLVPETRVLKSGKNAGQERVEWRKHPTESVWDGIVSLFAKAGYTEDYALQQARVARILRAEDYDFKRKEPRLWTPKK